MSILNYFKKVPATLTTYAPSVNTEGEVSRGAATTSTIIILPLQPAAPDQLRGLPEGSRKTAVYSTLTEAAADIHGADEQQGPDELTVGGKTYEVVQVGLWEDGARDLLLQLVTGVER